MKRATAFRSVFYTLSVTQSTLKSFSNSSLDDLMYVVACVLLRRQAEGGEGPSSVDDLEPKPWVTFGLPCRALRLERGTPSFVNDFVQPMMACRLTSPVGVLDGNTSKHPRGKGGTYTTYSVRAIIFVDAFFLLLRSRLCLTEEQRLRCRWYGGCVWACFAAAAVSPVGGFVCTMPCISPVGVFGGR